MCAALLSSGMKLDIGLDFFCSFLGILLCVGFVVFFIYFIWAGGESMHKC